ncbi:MAG: YabP/YqfC family sporulation protein [Oscillospiraceae bacterium]|jgi:sporulation protein YqfC|nr:YabP/YqfC family sporulation protein [Oscillospiraceae bacterium]
MSDKNKQRRGFREGLTALTGAMEMPMEAFSRNAKIELLSNREATVDGCRGVLEYSGEQIRLNIGHITVQFSGRNLELRSLNEHEAIITGFIVTIDFG